MSSFKDRKLKLSEQINAAKKKIDELKLKRAQEIGMLAIQSGLAEVDDNILKKSFLDVAKTL
jgi:hypothetical protein